MKPSDESQREESRRKHKPEAAILRVSGAGEQSDNPRRGAAEPPVSREPSLLALNDSPSQRELADRVIAPGEAQPSLGSTDKTELSLRSWR